MTSLLVAVLTIPGGSDEIVAIDKAATTTIEVKGYPDWLEVAFDSVWVSNPRAGAVQRIDPKTNQIVAEVKVNRPVAAMASGFGSVWVASRGDKSIVRIDPKSNTAGATVPAAIPDSEASIAAGEGGVWVVTDRKGVLSRIDPETNTVVAEVEVKPRSTAAMAGFGAVWVSNTGDPKSKENGSVQRVDPKTNKVVATIEVRGQPRFLAVGEGAVWVLNQADGTV